VTERCSNMDALDATIGEITCRFTKAELFEVLIRHRVPCAPVRTLAEVVNDPHLHARGALQWIDHPEYGRIVVPTSPLRFAGEDGSAPYRPSSPLGADTQQILMERLALDEDRIRELREQRVF